MDLILESVKLIILEDFLIKELELKELAEDDNRVLSKYINVTLMKLRINKRSL